MSNLMSDPNSGSAIRLSKEQEAEVAKMNSVSEIQAYMRRCALEQGLVEREPFDPSVLHELPQTVPQAFTKTVTLNGIKYVLEAPSPALLVQAETDLYRKKLANDAPTTTHEQPRGEDGKFIASPEVRTNTNVPVTDDAIAASLAPSVTAALEAAGIDVNALREFTESKQNEAIHNAWAAATETFRNAHADWPGGETNRNRLGEVLIELGLAESPSAENLSTAYEYMKKNNLLAENEEIALANDVNAATSYEELKSKIGYRGYDQSSGLWGR